MLPCGQGLLAPTRASQAKRGCSGSGTRPRGCGGKRTGGSIQVTAPGAAGQPAWPCPSLQDYHPAGESILILFNPNQG